MRLAAPIPIADDHDVAAFSCGTASLDEWLKRRAKTNHKMGATRTFVVMAEGRVIAYHALASGGVNAQGLPGKLRRNIPDPIPVAIWARVAIDQAWQGQGIGRGLFKDAVRRTLQAADAIGIRGILVHAISSEARTFYEHLGFEPSGLDPYTLVVTLADASTAFPD